jgi:phosphonoacetate hydrolase
MRWVAQDRREERGCSTRGGAGALAAAVPASLPARSQKDVNDMPALTRRAALAAAAVTLPRFAIAQADSRPSIVVAVQKVVAPGGAPGLWVADAALLPRLAAYLAAQPWCGALLARDPAALPEGQALPLALLGSRHPRSPDLVATFRGSGEPDGWGLPGRAPFDAPDVPEGGGMHGGLHAAELATLLLLAGGPVRRGAEVESVCDLTDVAPTVLALLGLAPEGMEGRPLQGAWQAGADAPPRPVQLPLGRDLALAAFMDPAAGRFYPSALTAAARTGRP